MTSLGYYIAKELKSSVCSLYKDTATEDDANVIKQQLYRLAIDHLSPVFSYPPATSSKLVEDQARFAGVTKSHGNSKYTTEIAN